jgi:8-oxo-dGTP diphosphatase
MKSAKDPSFSACGVHLVWNERFLLVQRAPDKRHPLAWSAVAGTIESGETPEEAIRREVREETGIELEAYDKLSETRYEHDGIGFVYHQFLSVRADRPEVVLNEEHVGYGWFTIEEARGLLLMEDELELLEETSLIVKNRTVPHA